VCFACGAQLGKHKNNHKYVFMDNGGFNIFSDGPLEDNGRMDENGEEILGAGRRRKSLTGPASAALADERPDFSLVWNAREEMRLLDAVEQYGYGNWKDIAQHVESKSADQCKEEYSKHFIHGIVGKYTWREEKRGHAVDHTVKGGADRGPLSPTLTGKLPPISVSGQEALLLGYMPHRDDFEDFDRETERLVAQIGDKSVEDEDVDVALKLAQCDIYERRLREQVRRKRVARDYQLVGKFYRENPIVQIGAAGRVVSPQKHYSQAKAVLKGEGPKQELIDRLRPLTQFFTAQEFSQFVSNVCVEKELKVRIKELIRYREHGLTSVEQLIPFERERFKRDLRNKRLAKVRPGSVPAPATSRFLPTRSDYSLKAILDPEHEEREAAAAALFPGRKKKTGKKKKSKWSKKKELTGRRLLFKQGCILTLASPARRDSTDSNA